MIKDYTVEVTVITKIRISVTGDDYDTIANEAENIALDAISTGNFDSESSVDFIDFVSEEPVELFNPDAAYEELRDSQQSA